MEELPSVQGGMCHQDTTMLEKEEGWIGVSPVERSRAQGTRATEREAENEYSREQEVLGRLSRHWQ